VRLFIRRGYDWTDRYPLIATAAAAIACDATIDGEVVVCDRAGVDCAEVFAHACELGLEGIVSKDRTRHYRSGPSKTCLKIKNPQAPG
jgi:ATP-dependent DNA ligase